MENKHTPAIPLPTNELLGTPYQGLTKREYAAIHCNEPIPNWFEPEMRKRPKEVHNLNFTFGPGSDHPSKEYFKYFRDGKWQDKPLTGGCAEEIALIPESLKIEVKNHIIKLRKWAKREREWKKDWARECLKQWRYYFADSLL